MRITEKLENGFYDLKPEAEVYGWENGIRLVQIVGKYEDLEEELGCPLDVRIKVNCDSHIYDENGIKYEVVYVYEDHFDCEDPFDNDMGYTKMCAFDWKDYGKTWWLCEDRSE